MNFNPDKIYVRDRSYNKDCRYITNVVNDFAVITNQIVYMTYKLKMRPVDEYVSRQEVNVTVDKSSEYADHYEFLVSILKNELQYLDGDNWRNEYIVLDLKLRCEYIQLVEEVTIEMYECYTVIWSIYNKIPKYEYIYAQPLIRYQVRTKW